MKSVQFAVCFVASCNFSCLYSGRQRNAGGTVNDFGHNDRMVLDHPLSMFIILYFTHW